jgi:hypothetical protein
MGCLFTAEDAEDAEERQEEFMSHVHGFHY